MNSRVATIVFALALVFVQWLSVSHAAEFGDDHHHHDQELCGIQIVCEVNAYGAPSPQIAYQISGFTKSWLWIPITRRDSERCAVKSIRGPPRHSSLN